jgi:hypothetical protein
LLDSPVNISTVMNINADPPTIGTVHD